MYTKDGCPWCDKLVDLLCDRAVDFLEVKVDHSLENLDELKSRLPDVKTVPQLFHGDVYVGDYTDSVAYFEKMDADADNSQRV